MIRKPSLLLTALVVALVPATLTRGAERAKGEYWVYVGTYTGKESQGIYACRFNSESGELTPLALAAESRSPSFLAIHPSGRFLYTANETADFDPHKSGLVTAFALDRETGKLTFLNQVSSSGAGPCYVTVDQKGKNVLVANYGGGSVAVLPVDKDGRLREALAFVQHSGSSVNRERQNEPHAHSIDLSLDNRFALTADLGLDQVLVYRFDSKKGSLTPNAPPFAKVQPGAGPRHLAFHPNGKFVYVINEIQSTISAFAYNAAAGSLNGLQTISTLTKDFTGENYTAETLVHPSGRFLYGSNRGHDSIVLFAIDPAKGTLTFVETFSTQGKWPRHFEIDPTGGYLFAANQNSGNIVIFRINSATGRLTPTGKTLHVASPACVKFVAAD